MVPEKHCSVSYHALYEDLILFLILDPVGRRGKTMEAGRPVQISRLRLGPSLAWQQSNLLLTLGHTHVPNSSDKQKKGGRYEKLTE